MLHHHLHRNINYPRHFGLVILELPIVKRRITIVIDTEYPSGKVSRIAETFDELKLATMKNPLRFLLDTINKMLKLSKEYIP